MKKKQTIFLRLPFSGDYPVTFLFGAPADSKDLRAHYQKLNLQGHAGVDFDVPEGTPVLAAAAGVVAQAGENGDFGLSVTLSHSWGISVYAHLEKTLFSVGKRVKSGTCIGVSGATGFVTGPHLHFAIKLIPADEGNGYHGFIDPMPYLKKKREKNYSPDVVSGL